MKVARTGLGYLYFRDRSGGDDETVYVHQLLAIAGGADPSMVFSSGAFEVHHGADSRFCDGTGVEHPRANWIENVELRACSEHARYHVQKRQVAVTDGGEASDG